MKRNLVTICAALPLLCCCEYSFDLKGDISEDKLNIICIVNEQGETYLNIENSIPINKYGKADYINKELEMVELSVNGEPCKLQLIETKRNGEGRSYTQTSGAEERMSLEAMAAGTKAASEAEADKKAEGGNMDGARRWNRAKAEAGAADGIWDGALRDVAERGGAMLKNEILPPGASANSFPEGFRIWKADRTVKPGETVEVKAKGAATREARTQVTVPSEIRIKSIATEKRKLEIGSNAKYIKLDITADDISDQAYYAVKIENRMYYNSIYYSGGQEASAEDETEPVLVETISAMKPRMEMEINDVFLDYGATETLLEASYNGYLLGENFYPSKRIYTFSGKEFKNGHLTLYIDSLYEMYKREVTYRVHLYRLSNGFYRYNKAVYMAGANILAQAGLAPANFSYSNVEGGFGVCAALTECVSDWFSVD